MQEKLREAEKMAKDLQDKFGTEEAKSVEMAAELITLVNQKAHLETVRKELRPTHKRYPIYFNSKPGALIPSVGCQRQLLFGRWATFLARAPHARLLHCHSWW